jgi:hypothetical protein
MLYFSIILYKRQRFTHSVAQVYHTFPFTNMFRPDGAIFRYIRVLHSPFLFLLLPTLASVYTLGVRCMYGLYMPFFLRNILLMGYLEY